MADKSKIEWTDATWNPVRGCSRVSEGCRHCYAETVANRFCGPGLPYEGVVQIDADGKGLGKWNGQIKFVEERLLDPLRWKAPRKIFVNSMSDLFHENVTDAMLDQIFAVMALCPQHTFQVLTKRPERMLAYLGRAYGRIGDLVMKMRRERGDRGCVGPLPHVAPGARWWPLANVWPGVSVEDQKAADERIPLLLQTPAAVRFLSVEPMLGDVDLDSILGGTRWIGGQRGCDGQHHGGGTFDCPRELHHHHDDLCKRGIDWVICGGESGPGARPMHPDWARSLRDQCVAAGVSFFFKQWGEYLPAMTDGNPDFQPQELNCSDEPIRVGKKAAGDLLDGVQWHQFPEVTA
jgi:protein gp37